MAKEEVVLKELTLATDKEWGRGREQPCDRCSLKETFDFSLVPDNVQNVHVYAGCSDIQRSAARHLGVDSKLQHTHLEWEWSSVSRPSYELVIYSSLALTVAAVSLEHLRLSLW